MPQTQEGNETMKTILFVGLTDEYHKYKGLELLIRAMPLIHKQVSDATLRFGYIPEEELVKAYQDCDVVVLPSTSAKQEGFGIVVLEAMACGRPVVVSKIVGAARLIRQYSAGIVVANPNDIKELAFAIISLLTNPDMVDHIGKNGRRLVEERYDWKMIAKQIERIYETI